MTLKEMARAMWPFWSKPVVEGNRRVHDYTQRGPGHDYTFTPVDGGLTAEAIGWGCGIESGDFLLLVNRKNHDGKAKYRVDEINYFRDPPDMWSARLTFVPRVTVQPVGAGKGSVDETA